MVRPLSIALLAVAATEVTQVTPVSGGSWLQHLGVTVEQTKMGRMGGEGPPGASERQEPTPSGSVTGIARGVRRFFSLFSSDRTGADEALGEPFVLLGEDLYRLDCRSCHGPDGGGAPPEINSLLDPVRATSARLVERRSSDQGRKLPPGMAASLAADAVKTLRDRLARGGKRMPPFPHLAGQELDSLEQYLRQLAGVPDAGPPIPVTESVARSGEHLAKGTCHVCHPATGPGVNHMMEYMRGVIPSLAAMPEQMSPSAVTYKVRQGAYGMMGMMARMARMPTFGYLTDEEVLAAYLYLGAYPPQR